MFFFFKRLNSRYGADSNYDWNYHLRFAWNVISRQTLSQRQRTEVKKCSPKNLRHHDCAKIEMFAFCESNLRWKLQTFRFLVRPFVGETKIHTYFSKNCRTHANFAVDTCSVVTFRVQKIVKFHKVRIQINKSFVSSGTRHTGDPRVWQQYDGDTHRLLSTAWPPREEGHLRVWHQLLQQCQRHAHFNVDRIIGGHHFGGRDERCHSRAHLLIFQQTWRIFYK